MIEKIWRGKLTTRFHTSDRDRVKKLLFDMDLISERALNYKYAKSNKGIYYLNIRLTDEQCQHIMDNFDYTPEERIFIIVSKYTGITKKAIEGKSQMAPVKIARQLTHHYIFKNNNDYRKATSITNNSRLIIYNSIKRVNDWGHYPDYKTPMDKIEPILNRLGL